MADMVDLQPGMILGGCRIVKLIGEGNMGKVFLAEHQMLQKPRVIKTAMLGNLEDPERIRRQFLKEARLAADIHHPNVVTIHDLGEFEGRLFMVMQYVQGRDLLQILKASRTPLNSQVLPWILDAAKGLDAVHRHGLIHRDIKPSNLMLTDSGHVLVMDFGLVRRDDPSASAMSGVVGSPAYMSPEQCRDELLDPRTDIFSLGATAYHLLAGKTAFSGSVHHMLTKLAMNTVPERLDQVRSGIPARVAELVARMMAPDRDQRIPDAHTLVTEIEHLLKRAQVTAGSHRDRGDSRSQVETGAVGRSGAGSQNLSVSLGGSSWNPQTTPQLAPVETASSSVRDTRHGGSSVPPTPRRLSVAGLVGAIVLMSGLIGMAAWGTGMFTSGRGDSLDSAVAKISPPASKPAMREAEPRVIAPQSENLFDEAPAATAPKAMKPWEVALNPDKGKASAPVLPSTTSPTAKMPKELPPPPVKTRPELLRSPFTAEKAREVRRSWSAFLGIPETVESIGTEPLLLIPAGEFQMGSTSEQLEAVLKFDADFKKNYADDEQPAHRVQITRPFYLGQHELTKGEFATFVAAASYKTEAERDGKGGWGFDEQEESFSQKPEYTWRNPGFTQTDSHPVVNVSWNDAVAYCNWRSRKEGKPATYKIEGEATTFTGEPGYRLPTEPEWEYACRAGSVAIFSCGDDPEQLATMGNIADGTAKAKLSKFDIATITATDGFVFTAPVGGFQANAFGLKDMHGNVWEWCQDVYNGKAYSGRGEKTQDPVVASQGSNRVARGGSWYDEPLRTRSADRGWSTPSLRYYALGFRLALSPSGQHGK